MELLITLSIFIVIVLIGFWIFYIKAYKKMESRYTDKINFLTKEIDRKCKIKVRDYHKFFNVAGNLFTKYQPRALTIYLYNHNHKLKNIIIKFLFQLIMKDGEGMPIFDNGIDGSSITTLETLMSTYESETGYHLIDDIETIGDYDLELYEELKSNNIVKLVLINFKDNHDKNVGFVVLSYTKQRLLDIDECSKDIQILTDIISKMSK